MNFFLSLLCTSRAFAIECLEWNVETKMYYKYFRFCAIMVLHPFVGLGGQTTEKQGSIPSQIGEIKRKIKLYF